MHSRDFSLGLIRLSKYSDCNYFYRTASRKPQDWSLWMNWGVVFIFAVVIQYCAEPWGVWFGIKGVNKTSTGEGAV